MPRSFFLINIILFSIIGLLSVSLYKTWTRPLDIPVPLKQKQSPAAKEDAAGGKKTPDESAYGGIVMKDLFRPSRTPAPKEAGGRPLMPQEKPQLFGTTIMGDQKFAILEDPGTKTTRLYYVNDSVGGFTVADITEDKVVLKWGTEMIDLRLRDNKNFTAPKTLQPPPPSQQPQAQQPPQTQPGQPDAQVAAPRRRLPARRRPPTATNVPAPEPVEEDASGQ